MIFAAYFKWKTEIAATAQETVMNADKAHDLFGHGDKERDKKIASVLGIRLTPGTNMPCKACAEGKAKQKNVPKITEYETGEKDGERVYLDISTIKKRKKGPKVARPNWRIMVIGRQLQLKLSGFFRTKNGMIELTCEQLYKWRQDGKKISAIRLDNAGENVKLQKRCASADWKLGDIDFEYTARDTPQQNHLAELGFAVLANRGRAMMAKANIPLKIRYKVFPDCFETATKLDGLTPVTIDGKTATRFEHWYGKNPEWSKHLKRGERPEQ